MPEQTPAYALVAECQRLMREKGHTPCNREGWTCLLTREHDGLCITEPPDKTESGAPDA